MTEADRLIENFRAQQARSLDQMRADIMDDYRAAQRRVLRRALKWWAAMAILGLILMVAGNWT